MAGIPSNIALASLDPVIVKGNVSPFVSTRPDLRDGTRPQNNPPAPPDFTLSAGSTSITATITDGKGADSYQIRLEGQASSDGLVLSGANPATTYAVQVRGVNQYGAGDWSASQNVTTDEPQPVADLPDANLYRNTFESGTPNDAELNTIGFSIGSLFNDLVTDLDGGSTGGQVYKSSIIDPPNPIAGKDWRAKEGSISMRVSCAAESGGTQNSEQNASFSPIAARDTWVRHWFRVPTNYAPTTDHINSQHKIFVLFQDGYSNGGIGSTVFMNIYRSGDFMASGLLQRQGTSGVAGGVGPLTNLFHATNDRGRWMQHVHLVRLESSPGAGDGEQKFWSRFEDESDFTLQNSATGLNLARSTVSGQEGFQNIRYLSAREGNSAERQDFQFDVLELANTPLVPAGTEGL